MYDYCGHMFYMQELVWKSSRHDERESRGSYGDWHFGVHVCVTCDIKQNSQKSK